MFISERRHQAVLRKIAWVIPTELESLYHQNSQGMTDAIFHNKTGEMLLPHSFHLMNLLVSNKNQYNIVW